jgi:hypothetical protein
VRSGSQIIFHASRFESFHGRYRRGSALRLHDVISDVDWPYRGQQNQKERPAEAKTLPALAETASKAFFCLINAVSSSC